MASTLPLPSAASNRNVEWITQNFDALVRDHPNCWVAVDKGRVLAADADLGVVQRGVDASAPSSDVIFHFVDDGSLIF